jgi:hypothetical protein
MLMDERDSVKEARRLGLTVTGSLGVLDRAAERGLIDLAPAIARLSARMPTAAIRNPSRKERLVEKPLHATKQNIDSTAPLPGRTADWLLLILTELAATEDVHNNQQQHNHRKCQFVLSSPHCPPCCHPPLSVRAIKNTSLRIASSAVRSQRAQ